MEQERPDDNQAGRKGGVASIAATGMVTAAAQRTALAYWSPDTIRWGPVWSGFLVALAIDLVLVALGIGSAFAAYDPASPSFMTDIAMFLSVWMAASLIVSTFIGGLVAGRNGAFLGMRVGWYQGTIVFALALLASLVVSSLAIGGMLGGASNLMPMVMRALPGSVPTMQITEAEALAAARNAASVISYAARVFFIGAIVQWGAGALGGWLGARGHVVDEADVVA